MLVICSILCTNAGISGFTLTANLMFLISNSATKSSKILKNISKFNLILADAGKNIHLIFNMKQLVLEFFLNLLHFFRDTRLIYHLASRWKLFKILSYEILQGNSDLAPKHQSQNLHLNNWKRFDQFPKRVCLKSHC